MNKNFDHNRVKRKVYKAFLYFYQDGLCAYCLRPMRLALSGNPKDDEATLEHINPVCSGGPTRWSNLVLACETCNSKKGCGHGKPLLKPLKDWGYGKLKGKYARVYEEKVIKKIAENICEAPNNYIIATPLLFPANMVESIVSQPVLQKRY